MTAKTVAPSSETHLIQHIDILKHAVGVMTAGHVFVMYFFAGHRKLCSMNTVLFYATAVCTTVSDALVARASGGKMNCTTAAAAI